MFSSRPASQPPSERSTAEAPRLSPRLLIGAGLLAAGVWGLVVASQVVGRSALTMDEIHTLLLGIAAAQGEPLSYYVGSVTRYEGGSWLIAFPVALLLKLGVSGTAATSWTAGGISMLTAGLGGAFVAALTGRLRSALLLPLVAAAAPELVHYSYRAWGSLCEALIGLPVLGLVGLAWVRRGRPWSLAILLGVAFAASVVLSYFHMITAVAFLIVMGIEGRGRSRRRVVQEVAVVGGTALLLFGLWIAVMLPYPLEAATVRDGRSLSSLLPTLLLPRLDVVLRALPAAFVGQLLAASPLRLAAGAVLSLLWLGGAGAGWRAGGPRRWPSVFLVAFLPALSVGHLLLGQPDVARYHLPFFAAGAVGVAAWGARPSALAVLCGLAFWLPSGLGMPYQNPTLNYLELGGNALHRYTADPHVKFVALRRSVPEWYRRWFAFGYGVDGGRRYSRARQGMALGFAGRTDVDWLIAHDQHFSLYRPESWVDFWERLAPAPDEREYLLGLGIGFGGDARLDGWEVDLLDVLAPEKRALVLEGFGAAAFRGLSAPVPVSYQGWLGRRRERVTEVDAESIGRGMARVVSVTLPVGSDLGLPAESPLYAALRRGQQAPPDLAWRAMVGVPMIPTPEPPPEGLDDAAEQ